MLEQLPSAQAHPGNYFSFLAMCFCNLFRPFKRYVGKDRAEAEGLLSPFPPSAESLCGTCLLMLQIAIGLLGYYLSFPCSIQRFTPGKIRGAASRREESERIRATRHEALARTDLGNQALSPTSGPEFGLFVAALKEYSYLVRNKFGFMLLIIPPAHVFTTNILPLAARSHF